MTEFVLENEVEVSDTLGHNLVDHTMGVQCEACGYIFICAEAVESPCLFTKDEDD